MFVLHLNWSNGSLRIWGEDSARFAPARDAQVPQGTHPYSTPAMELEAALAPVIARAKELSGDERVGAAGTVEQASVSLLLPYCETAK